MQPAFALARAPHDLEAQLSNAQRLDALRHSEVPGGHSGGKLFDSLPASFFEGTSASAVIQSLLQSRAARTPKSEGSRAEATEILENLTKIQDAINGLLTSEELGLHYDGSPCDPHHFLLKVLSRCPAASHQQPPPLGGSSSFSASSSQPAPSGSSSGGGGGGSGSATTHGKEA